MNDTPETPLGCTCFKLRKLTRTMSRVYDQHLATVGLKTTQYSLLANVARAALPVAELADLLATERTTLTRNLKPLIEADWVRLAPGADGRQRIVTITPAGLAKVKHAQPAWRAAQDETEQLLGRDAVRALHRQLDTTLTQLLPLLDGPHHAKPA
ncbi:MAG: MarR family winged helix-turn-helix transcriptional regulator [Pseudomonadota bacterium]